MGGEYAARRQRSADKGKAPARPAEPAAAQHAAASGYAGSSPRRIELPDAMRAKMEAAFGMDFSGVRIDESPAVLEAGAEAVAQGDRIAFAPGALKLSSRSGQELLGHELSHIAAQARGEARGSGFLSDSALEARADREGALAAGGQTVFAGAEPASPVPSAAAPMQAKASLDDKLGYTMDSLSLLGGIDSLLTSNYKNSSGNQENLVGLDKDSKGGRANDFAAAGLTAGVGAVNTTRSTVDAVKKGGRGDVAGSAAGILDSLSGVSDIVNGGMGLTDLIGYKGKNDALKTGSGIAGISGGAFKALSGAVLGFSSGSTQSAMQRRANNAQNTPVTANAADNDEIRKAYLQAGRNARADKISGILRAGTGILKGVGAAVGTFTDNKAGMISGKVLGMLGDGLNMFNTWNTGRMKANAQKKTLDEAFGAGALDNAITAGYGQGVKKHSAQGRAQKTAAIRAFLANHAGQFDAADLQALNARGHLKRKDVLQALSKRRTRLVVDVAGNDAVKDMGIHSSSANVKKRGVLAKLTGA